MTSDFAKDDDDLLAAEFALGLLEGDELNKTGQRAARDAAFARRVTDWEIRLAAHADDLAEETPGPAVKRDLLARLFPPPEPKPFWGRVWVWQALAALSLLVLAAFLTFDALRQPATVGPLYTAEIVAQAGDFRAVAVVDKTSNEVFLTRTRGAAPEGRILQVWAHGEGAPAISVGLWPKGDTVRLALPQTIAEVEGILTLGVSEEPEGGSVTGSPSGRVFGTVDIPGVVSGL